MNDVVEQPKIDWMYFGRAVWSKGVGPALRDHVVPVTSNNWDNMAVDLLDTLVDKFLPAPPEAE